MQYLKSLIHNLYFYVKILCEIEYYIILCKMLYKTLYKILYEKGTLKTHYNMRLALTDVNSFLLKYFNILHFVIKCPVIN